MVMTADFESASLGSIPSKSYNRRANKKRVRLKKSN